MRIKRLAHRQGLTNITRLSQNQCSSASFFFCFNRLASNELHVPRDVRFRHHFTLGIVHHRMKVKRPAP